MGVNVACPKCGSNKVQLSNVKSNHGLLKFIFFGIFYLMFILFKWMIGFFMLLFWDSWNSIIASTNKKGYVWQSRRWFGLNKRMYYCHECSYNFKG